MKNYFLRTLIIAIAALGVLTIQSCDTDPCANVDCGINGTCFEGTCVCDAGYDGADCNIVIRSLFTGVYDVEEICDSDPDFTDTYTSSINESLEGVQFITISNVYNFASFDDVTAEDATALASVSNIGGVFSLLIENQRFDAPLLEGFEISGTGTYDPATTVITLEYSITDTTLDPFDPAFIDNCVQAYFPQ